MKLSSHKLNVNTVSTFVRTLFYLIAVLSHTQEKLMAATQSGGTGLTVLLLVEVALKCEGDFVQIHRHQEAETTVKS